MPTMRPTALLLLPLAAALLAACAGPGPRTLRPADAPAGESRDLRCSQCGTVERIQAAGAVDRTAREDAVLGGGVVGGALGGEADATVQTPPPGTAPAPDAARYDIFVRMDDGRRIIVEQRELEGVHEGAYVEVRGGRARLRHE